MIYSHIYIFNFLPDKKENCSSEPLSHHGTVSKGKKKEKFMLIRATLYYSLVLVYDLVFITLHCRAAFEGSKPVRTNTHTEA